MNRPVNCCKCGKLKLVDSLKCAQCNRNIKRAKARQKVREIGILPRVQARGKSYWGPCKFCGRECKSIASACRPCQKKLHNAAMLAAEKLVFDEKQTVEDIRLAIDRAKLCIAPPKERKPKHAITSHSGDADLSFSKGLVKTCKLPDDAKPWRCSGCGGSILWEFTRCVRCDVQRVLTQAEIESLAMEITI